MLLLPILAEQLHAATGGVSPILVRTKGIIPKSMITYMKTLNITDRGSYRTLAHRGLRSPIEIYYAFLDYDAPQDDLHLLTHSQDYILFSRYFSVFFFFLFKTCDIILSVFSVFTIYIYIYTHSVNDIYLVSIYILSQNYFINQL
jgi:hypothetical protein